MTNRSSPPLPARPRGRVPAIALLTTLIGACTPAATTHVAQSSTPEQATITQFPGIPDRPDLVTVVPFYAKPDESDREKTKAVIPAEIDGHRSIFIVDIGCPPLMLNRTFLQPSPTGGVDTVTDANRIPDHSTENDVANFDQVHVADVHIGTFHVKFEDTTMKANTNAYLGHEWGNFTWVFSPRLGNIGLSVLSQFEMIIDYPRQRLVLIKVDSTGHRLVDVPAYTPKWSTPLIEISRWNNAWRAWGIAVQPDGTLDTLNKANNTKTMMMDTGSPDNDDEILGYPFLSHLGVVGFNHRAHQFILYR